ncbi:MAG TPA: CheR family methyltransferase [Candidatus Acidoferrales bacterium]|jgi:chemotaxis protein methyltransferase WspC|nr:CheR family methyltransferase [Candidatus Acidoferrales bacterium]
MIQIDFENLLKQTIGLDPASVGSGTIERAVRSRMMSLGMQQTASYWECLQTSSEELQELIESVVVPETWFFRDREAYTELVRLVSEQWLPSHPTSTLRVLSVPCCTGEEPYSLVMALLDAGLSRDRIKVDAVDISAQAIARARRAVYGSNSFRGEELSFRDRYFEHSRAGYSLPKGFRDLVEFHHENMLSSDFRVGASPYQIIFCRNVLIYFDPSRQQTVMETLNRLLESTGYLFVGPAEAFLATRNGFASVNRTMSFAFCKQSGRTGRSVEFPRMQLKPDRASSQKKTSVAVPAEAAVSGKAVPAPIAAQSLDLEDVRRLADAGRLTEATVICEDYLEKKGPSSQAYYLMGLMRDAAGDREQATDYYRKVLYLEPEHSEALIHLALVYDRQGDAVAAKRLRDRARRVEGVS